MRILLANINATMQALFHENEQLRKELEKLAAENKSLKEKEVTALWCNGQHR